jgi:hypothetical protein
MTATFKRTTLQKNSRHISALLKEHNLIGKKTDFERAVFAKLTLSK